MSEEQLALDGMPEPRDLPASERSIDDEWVQLLLDDPDAQPDDLLAAFQVTDIDPRHRDATLLHPRLAGLDLATVIRDWPEALRDRAISVTDNRQALEQWASSPVPYERAVVAMNPHCPSDLACALARDPEPAVRANALCCPQLPRSERAAIANRDPDPDVRDFARWLMTTVTGRDIIDGLRYTLVRGASEGPVARAVTYAIERRTEGPA